MLDVREQRDPHHSERGGVTLLSSLFDPLTGRLHSDAFGLTSITFEEIPHSRRSGPTGFDTATGKSAPTIGLTMHVTSVRAKYHWDTCKKVTSELPTPETTCKKLVVDSDTSAKYYIHYLEGDDNPDGRSYTFTSTGRTLEKHEKKHFEYGKEMYTESDKDPHLFADVYYFDVPGESCIVAINEYITKSLAYHFAKEKHSSLAMDYADYGYSSGDPSSPEVAAALTASVERESEAFAAWLVVMNRCRVCCCEK